MQTTTNFDDKTPFYAHVVYSNLLIKLKKQCWKVLNTTKKGKLFFFILSVKKPEKIICQVC